MHQLPSKHVYRSNTVYTKMQKKTAGIYFSFLIYLITVLCNQIDQKTNKKT